MRPSLIHITIPLNGRGLLNLLQLARHKKLTNGWQQNLMEASQLSHRHLGTEAEKDALIVVTCQSLMTHVSIVDKSAQRKTTEIHSCNATRTTKKSHVV